MNTNLFSAHNPVRRVEWYRQYMPTTYEFLTWQAYLVTKGTIEEAEARIAHIEAILEGFEPRILLFHDILNQMFNEINSKEAN